MFSIGDHVGVMYDDISGVVTGCFHTSDGVNYAVSLDGNHGGYIANNRIYVSTIICHESNLSLICIRNDP